MWLAILALAISASPDAVEVAESPKVGVVAGTVEFDGGKLLAKGTITFRRESGEFHGASIRDGKFAIEAVPAGEYSVTIEGDGVSEEYSHPRLTVLKCEIYEGNNHFSFVLQAR